MLCFADFKNTVIRLLKEEHPEYQFLESDVPKNNYHYTGVSISMKEESGGVLINITEYYAKYVRNEGTIQEIVWDIWDKYMIFANENYEIKSVINSVVDFEKIKDKIFCKVINREKNQDAVLNMPHKDILNLLCVFYIDFEFATVNIRNHLLEMWKISEEELEKIAMKNTLRESKVICEKISDILKSYVGQEKIMEVEDAPMWVVQMQKEGSEEYGARIILFKELLNNILNEYSNLPKQCFIIPSSIHDLIIIPCCNINITEINKMIRDVNSIVLDKENFLSDEAYYFDREKSEIKTLN